MEFWLSCTLKDNPINRLIINYAKKLKKHGISKLFHMFKAESDNKFLLEIKAIYRSFGTITVELCKERVRHGLEVMYFPVNSARIVQWEAATTEDVKNSWRQHEISTDEYEEVSKTFRNYRKIMSMRHRQNQYRILNNKIYTNERMYRFNMVEADKCETCGETETLRHILYDCERAKIMWDIAAPHIGPIPQYEDILYGSTDRITNNVIAATNYMLCTNRDKEINENKVAYQMNTLVKDISFIAGKIKRKRTTAQ